MKMFSGLFLFYMKQMLKSPLYMGAMLFMIVMLVSRFFFQLNESVDYMDYGNFVGEMTLIVQAVLLLFMVYFYKLFSDEFKFGVNNLFAGSQRVILLKIAALLCNHLIFLCVFLGFQLFLIFVYFQSVDIPFSSFYIQTGSFVIVYWLLPFVFAFFLGILTALLFGKSKMSLVFMIVLWIMIGLVNQELFSDYFNGVSFSDFESLFYIGTSSLTTVYRDLVGYEVSFSKYMKIIFWILSSIGVIFLLLFKSTRTQKERGILLGMVVVIVLVNGLISPKIFDGGKLVFSIADGNEEAHYYKKHEEKMASSHLQYAIERYDIELNASSNVKAKVKVTLRDIKSNTLGFVLYHFFAVKKVTDQEGRSLPFTQDGDFVMVKRIAEQPFDELTFTYDMEDSTLLPVSESYLFLPNYFSWIPTKANHAPFEFDVLYGDGVFVSSMQKMKPIEYTLTFKGDMQLYTNLSRNGDMYKGKVSGGISVMGGMITKNQFGEREVIHPNSWSNISDDWSVYKKALSNVQDELIDMFQLKERKLPDEIVLLAPQGERNSYLSSDHLLFQHGTLLNISSAVKGIPEVYLHALLWNYDNRAFSSYEQIEAFNDILAIFIRDKVGIKSSEVLTKADPHFIPTFRTYSIKVQTKIMNFYNEFYILPREKQQKFLILWYKKMEDVSDSWKKTIQLFTEYKEELK